MIYTITLNGAIDRILKFKNFLLNHTNRAYYDKQYAAGKGIHVSKMLSNLGQENLAIYTSGKNDDWFEQNLKKQNIKYLRIDAPEGSIRQNLKLIDSEYQTECNGLGVIIDLLVLNKIEGYLRKLLTSKDLVIISGSLPRGISVDEILNFLSKLTTTKAKFIFDFSDVELLLKTLQFKPLLIKPNETEMSKIKALGFEPKDLLKAGVQNIFCSQGKNGGTLYQPHHKKKYRLLKKFNVVNLAGCGDALIGGFASKIMQGKSIDEAIKFGITCGTATAVSETIASMKTINLINKEIKW